MSVASANPFNLLEQQDDEDGQLQTGAGPALRKENVKTGTSSKKTDQAPGEEGGARPRGGRGRGKGRGDGNETAFRDKEAGSNRNREKSTGDDESSTRPRGPRGAGRGGRGRGRDFDRHSQTGRTDSEKQVSQGWGASKNEWGDETAALTIAQEDQVEVQDETPAASGNDNWGAAQNEWGGPAEGADTAAAKPEPEPEEITKSLDEYLAEQAEKLSSLGSLPEARKPNEGNTERWGEAQAVERRDDSSYFGGKQREGPHRQRARKEKQIVEITPLPTPRPQRGGRGGRGGRGRGRGRGDYDEGGSRNAESYRGDSRYGNGDGREKAGSARQPAISLDDFPSL